MILKYIFLSNNHKATIKEMRKIPKICAYALFLLLALVLSSYSRPRYYDFLPTLDIFYDNSEAAVVKRLSSRRTPEDEAFYGLTDFTIADAFAPHCEGDLSTDDLEAIIHRPHVTATVFFLKYLINRPRPYQIDPTIDNLPSETGHTPALPAGHACQAYYLAKVLGRRYPEKKDLFFRVARRCEDARVIAGIHYPSDGRLSKILARVLP